MDPKITEKRWDKAFEPAIYTAWKEKKRYAFDPATKKPVYSIDTPPPYVNVPVHIGQVSTYVLMDMFARYRRMRGYEVLFPLGLDNNGLPIEMAAEKKFGKRLTEVSREEALKMCAAILEEASMASVESFLRCGISFNSWKTGKDLGDVYETDSPDYRSLTQETFIDLWNKELIYEAARINNWCPGCQTTLADAEVIYEDRNSTFNDIVFTCKETGDELIIGTTRPELVCTCGMVVFHPDDERYKHLEGKTAISPIFNKEIPIKAHPVAQIEKGTGLVMMCSAGDLSDIRFFREMNLEPVIAITKDGTMNEHAGFLKGLKVREARKKMIDELKAKGLLKQQKQTAHRTPLCERSKDEIEFIEMSEFYVKQVEYKNKMTELAHKLNFYSPKSRQILLDWIDSVSIDWPISRRRFYATEVPLWYCSACRQVIVPPKGKYYQPWKEKPPIEVCPNCSNKEFIGETRVFDTWFDSSNTPLNLLKYARNQKFFEEHAPATVRPQGKEIIRTWLYYTLLKCYLLTGKCIFKDAWINYHIVDEHGKKMSKSVGNIINPKAILDKYGAEPYRLWAAIEGNLEKTDFRCSFERIEGAGKTLTKLWNVARFISMFPKPSKKPALQELDQWIMHELNTLIALAKERYERYDFHNPSQAIKHFIWETFASQYLEMVKNRAYNQEKVFNDAEQASALYTLHYCLETILKLWAPVLPMLTFKVYEELTGKDIHAETFPAVAQTFKPAFTKEALSEVNSAIWKAKKDAGKSLKAEMAEVTIPETFRAIEKDFMHTHKVPTITYGSLNIKV